jgi:hypothetical protein
MRSGKILGERRFFRTKAQAETKADQLRALRRDEGASALSLSPLLIASTLKPLSPSSRRITGPYGKPQSFS